MSVKATTKQIISNDESYLLEADDRTNLIKSHGNYRFGDIQHLLPY